MNRPTFYKAVGWNGLEIDDRPPVVAMKRGPSCAHGLAESLARGWQYCQRRCGLHIGPKGAHAGVRDPSNP